MRALIFGINGQDGSYLADILVSKGYKVYGMVRRSSVDNLQRIRGLADHKQVTLLEGDLTDTSSIYKAIEQAEPTEVYNEADQDNVGFSHSTVEYSCDITGTAVGRILGAIREIDKGIKFFQPLSATMFGPALPPQNEYTAFHPQSPYACAKVLAGHLCQYYREVHGMFVSTAIMYNHDSPRRTEGYLLNKICSSVLRIRTGRQKTLALGNLTQKVDIGYARDYMKAAYEIMQLPQPEDYILGTGQAVEIGAIARYAIGYVSANANWEEVLTTDLQYHREGAAELLTGDITKAKKAFNFDPVGPMETCKIIIDAKEKEKVCV
jgi:GDPmannose 4,6-dehydratase